MSSVPDPSAPEGRLVAGMFAHHAADRHVLARGVRLRPVPEFAACLAYVPGSGAAPPALHRLNVTSWLIASLCDGRDPAAVAAGFNAWGPSTNGPEALRQGLLGLLQIGVLRLQPDTSTDPIPETIHEPA